MNQFLPALAKGNTCNKDNACKSEGKYSYVEHDVSVSSKLRLGSFAILDWADLSDDDRKGDDDCRDCD